MHGDLGIVTKNDIVLAISNSGETHELNLIVTSVREIGATLIAFTGNTNSSLARSCNLVIDVGVEREACPFGLAPTSSSTAALAMGDALAVALIEKRKFNEKDFYKFHPGGNLGMRLRSKVKEVMIGYGQTPKVLTGVPAVRAIEEMDANNKGFVLVTDQKKTLLGIFTDGDLRRLVKRGVTFNDKTVDEVMTRNPKTIGENISLALTIESMQRDEITTLVVADGKHTLKGYIHLHDILGRGGTLKIALP
jgi:arabinose-5-phosphate isomerase